MNTVSVEILKDLYYIGVNDRDTNLFENMWPLPEGVAYNSYLIVDEKTALLDTVKITKVNGFIENLKKNLNGRDLDYLIIHHMEPDHSGCYLSVLDVYPNLTFVGNKKAKAMFKDYLDMEPENFIEVKDGETLSLGKRTLTFVNTPMVHWPESMVSYESTDKILFSQDIFGGFGALNGTIFDDEMNFDFFRDEMRRYYSNIVGKFGAPVNAVLKKLSSLEISCICPSHGLIWRKYIKELIERYQKWANMEPTKEGVVIVYGSMYGHTAEMAEYLGRELGNRGIKDVIIFDSSKTDHSYIFSTIWKYKGLMLGSCAHNNDVYPKMEPLLHKLQNYGLKNRYLGIFGNMMWSGGGVKKIKEFADSLPGLEQIGEPIEIKGHVTPIERDRLIELANLMADKLIADRE